MWLGPRARALNTAARRLYAAARCVPGGCSPHKAPADRPDGGALEAARRFERFVSFSSELVITCDREGIISFVNPAAQALLGYEPRELVGRPWSIIVHTDDREREYAQIAADFRGEGPALPVQTRYVTSAGEVRLFSWTGGYDAESDEMFYVARDVTAEVAARAEAERRSLTDPLTGLANRRHFTAHLDSQLRRWQREGEPPGVLLIDLDHFKSINDTHGHATGDAVLRAAGERLTGCVREDDLVARWGGEEFAVMLASIPNEHSLKRAGERIRLAIARDPICVRDDLNINLTTSVGAALAARRCSSTDELIEAADHALYAAKHAGRNQTRCSRRDNAA